MKEEIIAVDNLKCDGCANTIERSLITIAGVKSVSINTERSEVRIQFRESITPYTVRKKLSSLGYPEADTGNTYQRVRSYISCAMGKINN